MDRLTPLLVRPGYAIRVSDPVRPGSLIACTTISLHWPIMLSTKRSINVIPSGAESLLYTEAFVVGEVPGSKQIPSLRSNDGYATYGATAAMPVISDALFGNQEFPQCSPSPIWRSVRTGETLSWQAREQVTAHPV